MKYYAHLFSLLIMFQQWDRIRSNEYTFPIQHNHMLEHKLNERRTTMLTATKLLKRLKFKWTGHTMPENKFQLINRI